MPGSTLYHLRTYAVATLLVTTAFFITQWLNNVSLTGTVFLLFFGAILGTATVGGVVPTLFATVVAALLCNYFLIEPKGSFEVAQPGDVVRLVIFLVEGGVIGVMSHVVRQSQQRTLQTLGELRIKETALVRLNKELEARVEQRTVALQRANTTLEQELSERHRVEAALRESEQRFHAIFDNSFQFTTLMTPEGIVLEVNQAVLEFTGVSRDEIIGDLLWETPCFAGGDAETLQQTHWAVDHAAQTGFARFELHLEVLTGVISTIDFSIKSLRDETGRVKLLIGEGRDITDKKSAWDALRRSEERFQKIFHASPVAMSITTLEEGTFIDANEALCKLYGYHREELIGRTANELNMWVEGFSRATVMAGLKAKGSLHSIEARVRTKAGDIRDVLSSLELVDIESVPVLLGIGYDVTDRKQAELALQASHTRMGQWVAELEQHNLEISLLNEMNDLLQAARDEANAYAVIVRYIAQLFPQESGAIYMLRASRNLAEQVVTWGMNAPTIALMEPNDCWGMRRGRVHISRQEGASPPCHHTLMVDSVQGSSSLCVPLVAFGETLGLLQIVTPPLDSASLIPASEREPLVRALVDQIGLSIANLKLRENLRFQAIRDPLTGLYNRRFMQEALHHELQRARVSGSSIGVIMVDVDHFKRFNDTFGHQAGDVVLKAMGAHLQAEAGDLQLACRYGGEEFALILPDATQAQAMARAEQLRTHIKNLALQHGKDSLGTVTISVGIAMYPTNGQEPETLLHSADRALYSAKQEGRDRVVVYN